MSSASGEPRLGAPEPGSDGRLDSWKEVAAYLRRSVRSAKRWEKEERLPVRRHLHGKRDSVYAYREELDGWWENRGAKLTDQDGAEDADSPAKPETLDGDSDVGENAREEAVTSHTSPRPRRAALIAAGFALAAALVGVVAWLSRNGPGPSAGAERPLPFQSRDWVLVSSFENRTGEPFFDDVVEYALEREIADSRYVSVMPRQRVVDVLRLMRKPPDTRVDAALGREICVRDGGIRALLTGRIDKSGSNYLLSIGLVDPKNGVLVSSFAEEMSGRDRIAQALRRSSHRVRQILGEAPALIRESEEKLASVTTPSLKALRLYSRADALLVEGEQDGGAEELLKQAVAEDPGFASGQILLAWAIWRQLNRPEQDWRRPAEKAFELAGSASERERYFIEGSYYQMTDRLEKAKASYEALVGLYPDDFWASTNILGVLDRLGQFAAAADYAARNADLNPGSFSSNCRAASNLLWAGRQAASETYRLRAESLVSPETIRHHPYQVANLRLLPAYGLWLRGEVSQALQIVSRSAALNDSRHNSASVPGIAGFYLLLGRLRDAERWWQLEDNAMRRESALAMIALDRGDAKAMGRHLKLIKGTPKSGLSRLPFLLLRAGLLSEAESEIQAMEKLDLLPSSYFDIARGELCLARGRKKEGIALLRQGLKNVEAAFGASPLMGSESLARVLEADGKLNEAAEVLERSAESIERIVVSYGWDTGNFWMKNRNQLAGLYRRMGREQEARKIEDELRRLLACADPDHALARELNRPRPAARVSVNAR